MRDTVGLLVRIKRAAIGSIVIIGVYGCKKEGPQVSNRVKQLVLCVGSPATVSYFAYRERVRLSRSTGYAIFLPVALSIGKPSFFATSS